MESFIKEYTSLKEELARMREACESLRKSNLKGDLQELKNSIFEISSSKTPIHRQSFRRDHRTEPEGLRPILKDRGHKRHDVVFAEPLNVEPTSKQSFMQLQPNYPYQYGTLDSYQRQSGRRKY